MLGSAAQGSMRTMPPQPSAPTAAPTVYFDGACPVCRREMALYQRQPGADQVCWVDVTQCAPEALQPAQGPALDRQAALARLHVRRADGQLVSGAAAFLVMWAALPRTAGLARALDQPWIVPLLDLAYRAFLRLRRLWRRAR